MISVPQGLVLGPILFITLYLHVTTRTPPEITHWSIDIGSAGSAIALGPT